MPGGRPTDYDPAYCERVIEIGKTGASVVEMACEIGVSRNTLETNWPAAHPEFMEALGLAREESQRWWERIGRQNLEKATFQSSVWSRSMAARFPNDWREKQGHEHSGPNGGPIVVAATELTDEQLSAIAAR